MSYDTKGISLAEVSNKYPQRNQLYGYDILLDYDSTNKPKVISTFETCINAILMLLFMKPGQYPSIPELGIDIEQYLCQYSDDKNILSTIKTKLTSQCEMIEVIGVTLDVYFDKTNEGIPALVIQVKGNDYVTKGSESSKVIIGISYDKLQKLYTKITFVNNHYEF